jgi:aminoglycoside phosphotransferase (APT) family kinase protein
MLVAKTPARDCELSVEIATAVLREQMPELAPHGVRFLAAGWDHEAFEVNGEWIVRLPMRVDVAVRVPVEVAALELAAEVIELEVPRITLRGVPSAAYPYPFTGYRKLRGTQADRIPLDAFRTVDNARALGRALGALHAVDVARAATLGVTEASLAEHSAADRAEGVLRDRAAIDAAVGRERARRYADFLAECPLVAADAGACVLRHDDLHLEHVLVEPGSHRVRAIIDWTDANIGDPAGDFVLLFVACGEPFVQAMLDAYEGPADPNVLERIRLRARWSLLHRIRRALESNPGGLGECLACFDHVFPPA